MSEVLDSIRTEDGFWLNSDVFREEGIKFNLNKNYCTEPYGSPSHLEYWNTQLDRCKKGYQVGKHKVTGHHYSFLNFSEIDIVEANEDGEIVATKETKCPDFWDGDYDYYWCLDIAKNGLFTKEALATNELEKSVYKMYPKEQQDIEKQKVLDRLALKVKPHPDFLDGGNHMIIGKSRRKGYSYKNADICKNIYNTIPKSLTLIGAFDKKYLYPEGTMGMASSYLSFINKNTAWGKAREYVDKQEHKRASFKEMKEGIVVEEGYMSDIMALTFKDNPAAARGKDAKYVLLEEAGAFPNLKAAYQATQPGLTAGKYITGQILIFGTGGDMESGTADFAEMFYNPIQFGLMPFINIWDVNAENTYCGFFHPVYLNMEGYYDRQGNSDIKAAKEYEMGVRAKLIRASTSSNVIQTRVQEYPMSPSEAFLTVSTNDFPIVELRKQYNIVVREALHLKMGQPCYLTPVGGKTVNDDNTVTESKRQIKVTVDLDRILEPLWTYKPKTKDLKGSVVIYEHPVYNAPKGLYKIGFDPYRQVDGTSLAAIYVYKTMMKGDYTRNIIVAQYIGRPYSPDTVNKIFEMLIELYNTEGMYENEVTHVKTYFENRKKLHLLAAQPDKVISKNIKASKVARIYGCHMTEQLKDAGEKYIKDWLLTIRDYDEHGDPIYNLDTIYDPALLEELMLYNRKAGNFDRVMALMMVMFQIAEDEPELEKQENTYSSLEKDFVDLANNQFSNAA